MAVKGKTKGVKIFTVRRELDQKTEEAWKTHNQGMRLYYERNFEKAAKYFDDTAKLLPKDKTAPVMAERSRGFLKAPPPENWDGVEIMTEK